ncbi:MAG: cadherin-like beta sandwich domain-containing protein, partial [Polyangiaceae bacterium]
MTNHYLVRRFLPLLAWLPLSIALSGCSNSDAVAPGAAAGAPAGGSAGASSVSAAGSAQAGSSAAGNGTAGSSASAGSSGAAGAAPTSAAATLSALEPSVGALIPVFNASTVNYSLRVPSGTASVSLTPTASAGTSQVAINGVPIASGSASLPVAVPSDGKLSFRIEASAAAALRATTYTVTLSVQPVPTQLSVHSVGDSTMADY